MSTSLASAVSSIRGRLGMTMVEFADLIGATNSTISKYESGRLVPSKTVLILLFLLADESEKPSLREALGVWDEKKSQASFPAVKTKLTELLKTLRKSRNASALDRARIEFAKEALALLAARTPIDPAAAEILGFLRAHAANRKLHASLPQILTYLEVALAERRPASRDKTLSKSAR